MSWDGQNVWFHCFSHPHITTFGAMRCSVPGLIADFKVNGKLFKGWFQENIKKGLIFYDPEMLLWFPKYLKHNPPASANVLKSWPKVLDTLPDCPLKIQIIDVLTCYIQHSKFEEPECLQQLLDLKEGLKVDLTLEHTEGHALDPLSVYTSNNINNEGAKNSNSKNGLSRFDEFWNLYPKKKSKGDAEKAWSKLPIETKDRIIQVLPHYVFEADDPKYIPYPATWLNAKGWDDVQIRRNPNIPKGATVYQEECSTCNDCTYTVKGKITKCPGCGRTEWR